MRPIAKTTVRWHHATRRSVIRVRWNRSGRQPAGIRALAMGKRIACAPSIAGRSREFVDLDDVRVPKRDSSTVIELILQRCEIRVPDVSFVIPAYNEQRFLPQTLASIQRYAHPSHPFEVIVVDHGSTDDTVAIARRGGATVLELPDAGTISDLRNAGVQRSVGRVLVFLDADTTITAEWQVAFAQAKELLDRRPLTLTGAGRAVPSTASWVSRMWFRGFDSKTQWAHLGGGHMLTTRQLFDSVGGFPPELETGEDYEFCQRARAKGAEIVVIPELRALHHGVPGSARQFLRREMWHGRGEWQATSSLLKSKVAAGTLIFFTMHITGAIGVLSGTRQGLITALISMLVVGVLCLASAVTKYAGQPVRVVLANCAIFYLFYVGRALSLVSVLIHRARSKHVRAVQNE